MIKFSGMLMLSALVLCCSVRAGVKTVSYRGMDGREHAMEIHFPYGHSPSEKVGCFVFFHGGGWSGGNLNQGTPFCEYLASRGMVAVTADYSMHPKADLKNVPDGESRKRICVMDGKTVVRWVKQHAGELGIDPGRIAVGGASAGGHISVLQMMDEQYNSPSDSKEVSTDVQAFVLLCPAFTLPARDKTPDVNVFQWLEKEFPPTLFIVGETDNWKKASDELIPKLVRKGADVEAWMGPGEGHMFFRTDGWMTPTLLKIDAFLSARGLLDGTPTLAPGESDHALELIGK